LTASGFLCDLSHLFVWGNITSYNSGNNRTSDNNNKKNENIFASKLEAAFAYRWRHCKAILFGPFFVLFSLLFIVIMNLSYAHTVY